MMKDKKAYWKKCRLKYKERIKEYRLKNREHAKEWRLKNREKILKQQREYNLKNKGRQKEWYLKNKEHAQQYAKKYRLKNKEHIRKSVSKQKIHRYRTDIYFKLRHNCRTRIGKVLKGKWKSASTMRLIGCTIEELWVHLESKFEPWMTRENHGLWHVDHIKACSKFDLTDPAQQRKCFHWSNLQPLEAVANIRKGNR